jgi:hypothetical protein
MIDDIQKEQLRHTTMAVLAIRHPNALTRKQVQNRVAMEVDFEVGLPDVVSALAFLKELGHVQSIPDEFGATEHWKATAQGVVTHERSQRPGIPRHD